MLPPRAGRAAVLQGRVVYVSSAPLGAAATGAGSGRIITLLWNYLTEKVEN